MHDQQNIKKNCILTYYMLTSLCYDTARFIHSASPEFVSSITQEGKSIGYVIWGTGYSQRSQ